MHPRQALKAQLAAKGVAIPLDTPTPDLEEMLKAVEGFNACLDASNSSLRITCPDGEAQARFYRDGMPD
jgi:hypothetical protein